MKNLKKMALAAALVSASIGFSLPASADVVSLRGGNQLDATSVEPARFKQETASGGFKRSWKTQPPTIPHNIDNDRITLKENTCLNCHSEATFKKEKAPRIGDSHFVDASGQMMKDMSMRRFFCSQCHVPQVDANPLVENTFEGAN
ncbi:MAG: nitrate reductase cytochrome c-type subunit [Hyphomicrobiales bacterium]|nr:nitrate reductase cytochrome c-type subunit [Hyphomicrobiales bacterium]